VRLQPPRTERRFQGKLVHPTGENSGIHVGMLPDLLDKVTPHRRITVTKGGERVNDRDFWRRVAGGSGLSYQKESRSSLQPPGSGTLRWEGGIVGKIDEGHCWTGALKAGRHTASVRLQRRTGLGPGTGGTGVLRWMARNWPARKSSIKISALMDNRRDLLWVCVPATGVGRSSKMPFRSLGPADS